MTFAENAKIKAGAVTSVTGMISVADDSGLEVDALGGAPGIHSARWGGPNKDFGLAMERVNRELEVSGSADRSAKFVCALALGQPRGETLVRIGKINGDHLSGRRAARAVLVTIRSSCRRAILRPSARWTPRWRKAPSPIACEPSRS